MQYKINDSVSKLLLENSPKKHVLNFDSLKRIDLSKISKQIVWGKELIMQMKSNKMMSFDT